MNEISNDNVIFNNNPEEFELNIQPDASILGVFSRLSYKPWYAIAEFVDNSTQSYFSNMEKLKSAGVKKLIVNVKYDANQNTLTIKDNAFGMEIDDFKNAILLDSRNEKQIGRNEFGMGLKTAASWFGNKWSVVSTQLGSKNQYHANIDIPALKENGLNNIKITRKMVENELHGTKIIISEVTKKVTGPRTIGKIKDLLSSMYRRDINSNNIELIFNDEVINFENYPILKNFRDKEWKKELDFSFFHDDKVFNVTGFVAIMDPGSFPKAGFSLFRHDRVIIGGTDLGYKPQKIFMQSQSQVSLKLFGELNMNDFPVNQAKDGFVWDDGLEDVFISELKNNIAEYIQIADMSKKARVKEDEFSKARSDEIQEQISKTIVNTFDDGLARNGDFSCNYKDVFEEGSDAKEFVETILHGDAEEKLLGPPRIYDIPLNTINKVKLSVQWAACTKDVWVEFKETDIQTEVVINVDHAFFKPYSNEPQFKVVLEKFVISFVIAELQAKASSNRDGLIYPSTIRSKMNLFLSKMED